MRKYDLEERTAKFAESIIELLRTVNSTNINKNIISQLTRSAGSIGANYFEAVEAESKRDFIHKIGISRKEAKEAQLWIRLLAKSNPDLRDSLANHWREAEELIKIFSQSIKTARNSLNINH